MEINIGLSQNSLLQEEFIKVFKCYVSVIDSFKDRFLKTECTYFDDKYYFQLQSCKNIHNNWIIKHQYNQPEEIIGAYYDISSLLTKMVKEYLETTLRELNLLYEEFI